MDKDLVKEDCISLCALLNKTSVTVKERWEQLGHKLGLSKEKLCTINKNYKNSEKRFFAVINTWIRRKGVDSSKPSTYNSITIRALVHALQSAEVCESSLADKLVEINKGSSCKKGEISQKNAQKSEHAAPMTIKESKLLVTTASMPEFKLEQYLRMYYSRSGLQHQKDEWLSFFKVKYINLILIQQLSWNKLKARKNIKLIKQGKIEGVGEQSLHLENIMAFNGRVCIINGAPGVGKTRLASKLCKEWARKQLLKDYDLVLYIPLREPIARLSVSVDELLEEYFGENCTEGDRDLIRKKCGEGVLFILDGWDELKPSLRGDSQFFPKLIRGHYLPGCSIIVTSRPGASQDICNVADQVIEVLGFGRKEVKEYINAYFGEEDASKLLSDLLKYPNVASTCYVAINLAIVCYVYHALDYDLPQTLTEVYQWFVIHTVLRYLQKRKLAEQIDENLPTIDGTEDFFDSNRFDDDIKCIFKESVKDKLQKLGKLALSGLEKDDLCFSKDALVGTCELDADDHQFDGFGLLKSVQINHTAGSKPYFHFLHLSIQEFIAAFHISQMEEKTQLKWLRDDEKYGDMLKFLCGIDHFKSASLRIFIKNAEPVQLFHLECVYEGQWKDYCRAIADKCSNSFTPEAVLLHPQQWVVLGYVISNSERQWSFKWNKFLEENSLANFSRQLTNIRALHHFIFDEVTFGPGAIMQASEICKAQQALMELDIVNCDLSDEDLFIFSRALQHHPSLKSLCIHDQSITTQGLGALLQLLPTLPTINNVKLNFTQFSSQDYLAIKQCCASKCNSSLDLVIPEGNLCFENTKEVHGLSHHVSSQPASPNFSPVGQSMYPEDAPLKSPDPKMEEQERKKEKESKVFNHQEMSPPQASHSPSKKPISTGAEDALNDSKIEEQERKKKKEYSQEISPSEASRSSTQKPISTGAVNDLQDALNDPTTEERARKKTKRLNLLWTTILLGIACGVVFLAMILEQQPDCTKITGRKELEKVLEEISDTHPDKICSDLKIKSGTCNTIERKDMFTLSRKYMEQNPDPCWEDIIKILCEDFYQLALAKRVLTKYRVPVHVYSMYCQE